MADTLSELQGCDLLARLFKARGYSIARNVLFREYGVEFHIDGWDAAARVGFEFLTSEDDDHDDLTLEEYNVLTSAQRRGELALFIIDEVEPLSAADLAAEAHDFLDEVADAARARLRATTRRKPAVARKVPAKTSAGKTADARKPARAKPVAKKPAAKKPARAKPVANAAKAVAKKPAKKAAKKAAKKRPAARGRTKR